MVCFRHIIVNTLHEGDNKYYNNNIIIIIIIIIIITITTTTTTMAMMVVVVVVMLMLMLMMMHCMGGQLIGHKRDKRYNSLDCTYFVCVLFLFYTHNCS